MVKRAGQSWLDMVSASQAAQPNWMTPLVTVTPRLEQEFRWDVYDQQNGHGTQGNGQHYYSNFYRSGPRIELIPAYNWEVILAAPSYVTASGPRGTVEGWGDWPAFAPIDLAGLELGARQSKHGTYCLGFTEARGYVDGGAIGQRHLKQQGTCSVHRGDQRSPLDTSILD
jgi:hypothetical protein